MSKFSSSNIYTEIKEANEKYKNQQLNFRFNSDQFLELLKNLPDDDEIKDLISESFHEAIDKSDKRPMTEQLNLKHKYQKTHGLVFKNIPVEIPRQVVYNSILKLGKIVNPVDNSVLFPGTCKMRSFFFPEIKKEHQKHRVCFPVFVNKQDQVMIYEYAQMQDGRLKLEFNEADLQKLKSLGITWDGVVVVELTRYSDIDDDQMDAQKLKSQQMPQMYPMFYYQPVQNYQNFMHNGPINQAQNASGFK